LDAQGSADVIPTQRIDVSRPFLIAWLRINVVAALPEAS